jgi:nicotinate-nucleotide adenylyltransferase
VHGKGSVRQPIKHQGRLTVILGAMDIALFGGGFDPPHLGHQFITQTLLDRTLVDEVWYVPVKQHPFGKKLSPDHHRLAMLKLIVPSADSRIKIETYELDKQGMSYSYETLEHLHQKYPEHRFSWVIGSDNLPTFDKWLEIHSELLKYPFYIYPRKGFPMKPLYPGMIPLQDVKEVEVSSTEVRHLIEQGKSAEGLIAPAVGDYISDHGLYQVTS